MEYVTDRGVYVDLPFERMLATFATEYGRSDPIAAARTRDEAFH